MELGTGGYTNNNHLKPEVYLDNPDKIAEFKDLLKEFDLEISVLSCHGNRSILIKKRPRRITRYLWTPAAWRNSSAWIRSSPSPAVRRL